MLRHDGPQFYKHNTRSDRRRLSDSSLSIACTSHSRASRESHRTSRASRISLEAIRSSLLHSHRQRLQQQQQQQHPDTSLQRVQSSNARLTTELSSSSTSCGANISYRTSSAFLPSNVSAAAAAAAARRPVQRQSITTAASRFAVVKSNPSQPASTPQQPLKAGTHSTWFGSAAFGHNSSPPQHHQHSWVGLPRAETRTRPSAAAAAATDALPLALPHQAGGPPGVRYASHPSPLPCAGSTSDSGVRRPVQRQVSAGASRFAGANSSADASNSFTASAATSNSERVAGWPVQRTSSARASKFWGTPFGAAVMQRAVKEAAGAEREETSSPASSPEVAEAPGANGVGLSAGGADSRREAEERVVPPSVTPPRAEQPRAVGSFGQNSATAIGFPPRLKALQQIGAASADLKCRSATERKGLHTQETGGKVSSKPRASSPPPLHSSPASHCNNRSGKGRVERSSWEGVLDEMGMERKHTKASPAAEGIDNSRVGGRGGAEAGLARTATRDSSNSIGSGNWFGNTLNKGLRGGEGRHSSKVKGRGAADSGPSVHSSVSLSDEESMQSAGTESRANVGGIPCSTSIDVWAVGVLTYVLLVGRHPFKRRSMHGVREFVCVHVHVCYKEVEAEQL